MRAILKAHGVTDRTVWVADSFEGLPAYDGRFTRRRRRPAPHPCELAISVDQVKDNFRRYDLLDEQVRVPRRLVLRHPARPRRIEQLAVLRLDGDMYSSTMDALDALYDKVSLGRLRHRRRLRRGPGLRQGDPRLP